MNDHQSDSSICFEPIGVIRTPFRERYLAPIQAEHEAGQESIIELLPHRNFETALRDLDSFSHIWVIWHFHEARSWKPIIQTPRDGSKHGVFATRSPHRPNPIAISALQLVKVDGRFLTINGADMLDGTPVLDIKPYIPLYDSFAEARSGWTDSPSWRASYSIHFSERSEEQLEVINNHVDYALRELIERRLTLNPFPTSSNRIEQIDGTHFVLASRAWRIDYQLNDNAVTVLAIRSAYTTDDASRMLLEIGERETAAHLALMLGDSI